MTVSHDYMMVITCRDGRGRSAFALMKRTCSHVRPLSNFSRGTGITIEQLKLFQAALLAWPMDSCDREQNFRVAPRQHICLHTNSPKVSILRCLSQHFLQDLTWLSFTRGRSFLFSTVRYVHVLVVGMKTDPRSPTVNSP